jgi:hypothetical protein
VLYTQKEAQNVTFKIREGDSPKTILLKGNIFCHELANRTQQRGMTGALSPCRSLKGLRSRADFEIEFIQIRQNLQ